MLASDASAHRKICHFTFNATPYTQIFCFVGSETAPRARPLGARLCSTGAASDVDGNKLQSSISYNRMREIRSTKINPAYLTFYKKPVLVHKGRMQYLWDHDGKKYLDLFAGIVTVSVGHCHPLVGLYPCKVNEALLSQARQLWHTTSIYMTPPIHEYAEKLTAKLPSSLSVCMFVNSGSEANDLVVRDCPLALLMARLHTGRFEVIAMRNGYHGLTQTVMGATNLATWKQPAPVGFGILKAVNADPYRGAWGGRACRDSPAQTDRHCDCTEGECHACDMYVDQLQDCLDYDLPSQGPAALLIESIQGVGGTVQYPRGFLRRAFELVRRGGGLCISDEVQTGFGRLGDKFWGFDTQDATPDMVTMAKGIGNGFPLGAVVTTPEVASSLKQALFFNTYGGNPLACAVGSAVLDVIEDEGLQQHCKTLGTRIINELQSVKADSAVMGDVRGKGLMIGIELVSDKETRQPLDAASMSDIFEELRERGILIGKSGLFGNVLRIKPPMCITDADADFALETLRDILCDPKWIK